MTTALKVFLFNLASALEEAVRSGAETDHPEGTRYIRISDTLATSLAGRARELAAPAPILELPEPVWNSNGIHVVTSQRHDVATRSVA